MKLTNINEPEAFVYMERYLGGGTRTYSQFAGDTAMQARFQPTSLNPGYRLPLIHVPKQHITIHQANPATWLSPFYESNEIFRLPVHPELLADRDIPEIEWLLDRPIDYIKVIPTSSFRTVLTNSPDVPQHFIKLHFPKRISRGIRWVNKVTVEIELAVSLELAKIHHPQFGYLPETYGATLGNADSSWGYLIRERTVKPPALEGHTLVPLFALYGQDIQKPGDLPLLVQLINHHQVDALDFVIDNLIAPLIETWILVARELGILLIDHGQNVLLELDDNFNPQRLVRRDYRTLIDSQARIQRGLHLNFPERYLRGANEIKKYYSLQYDSYIGHHLLAFISNTLQLHFDLQPGQLEQRTKQVFHHCIPDADKLFPQTIHYYSDRIMANNQLEIVDTKKPPIWR